MDGVSLGAHSLKLCQIGRTELVAFRKIDQRHDGMVIRRAPRGTLTFFDEPLGQPLTRGFESYL